MLLGSSSIGVWQGPRSWTSELLIRGKVGMELMLEIIKGYLDQEQIAGEIKHGIAKALFSHHSRYKPASFASFSECVWVRFSII